MAVNVLGAIGRLTSGVKMLPALIAGGASIIGGLLGKSSSDKAAEVAAQNNAAIIADKEKDRGLQREFAQSGIQWRVQDAKAAGIHPIYALGGSGASYTPSAISLSSPAPDNSLGAGIAAAGQNIGRAVAANSTKDERIAQQMTTALQLERGQLENELLRSQIARLNAPGTGPGVPSNQWLIDGQGETARPRITITPGLIKDEAMKRTVSDPLNPSNEPGAISDVGYSKTPMGTHYPIPSDDVKQRIEDNAPHEWSHYIRNNLLPTIGVGFNPPYKAPPDKRWVYEPMFGYHLVGSNPVSRWFGRR